MRWRAGWRRAESPPSSSSTAFRTKAGRPVPTRPLQDSPAGDAPHPPPRGPLWRRSQPHLRDGLFGRRPCLRRPSRPLPGGGLRARRCRDRLSARPDLAAPIYPVVSMTAPTAHAGSRKNLIGEKASPERERAHSPHLHIRTDAPPAFLLHAEDDASVPVENSLLLRSALLAAKGAGGDAFVRRRRPRLRPSPRPRPERRGLAGDILGMGPKEGIVRVKRLLAALLLLIGLAAPIHAQSRPRSSGR
jgi:hypothetical protein